jgi:hypothetical protein
LRMLKEAETAIVWKHAGSSYVTWNCCYNEWSSAASCYYLLWNCLCSLLVCFSRPLITSVFWLDPDLSCLSVFCVIATGTTPSGENYGIRWLPYNIIMNNLFLYFFFWRKCPGVTTVYIFTIHLFCFFYELTLHSLFYERCIILPTKCNVDRITIKSLQQNVRAQRQRQERDDLWRAVCSCPVPSSFETCVLQGSF